MIIGFRNTLERIKQNPFWEGLSNNSEKENQNKQSSVWLLKNRESERSKF